VAGADATQKAAAIILWLKRARSCWGVVAGDVMLIVVLDAGQSRLHLVC
jgi:hypothetical protein